MHSTLLALSIWPVALSSSASLQPADSLGSAAFLAASAPGSGLPSLDVSLPAPRLRTNGGKLQTAMVDVAAPFNASVAPRGVEQYDELEEEALAIDAELAHTEKLIGAAWEDVRRAPLTPTLINDIVHRAKQDERSVLTRIRDLVASAPVVEWYFFAVAISLMIAVDLVLLQHLPEIERTHVGILLFWVVVAGGFCMEVWVRRGQKAGISWASGYMLELIFSLKNLFIFNLIFHILDTPRRLMRKALLVTVIGSICLRFAFHVGLAASLNRITILPFALGAWLIYVGTQQLAVSGRCDEEATDVTQTSVVHVLRCLLGERLGEFYDEEGEAIILFTGKKVCVTLLGVVIACLLTVDLLFGPDATLVKLDLTQNPYLSFSSSILALFTLRALFSVFRDILSHLSHARYCTGLILFFVGSENLVAHFTEVSALMSLIVVMNVIMLMATVSAVKDSTCPKRSRGMFSS